MKLVELGYYDKYLLFVTDCPIKESVLAFYLDRQCDNDKVIDKVAECLLSCKNIKSGPWSRMIDIKTLAGSSMCGWDQFDYFKSGYEFKSEYPRSSVIEDKNDFNIFDILD